MRHQHLAVSFGVFLAVLASGGLLAQDEKVTTKVTTIRTTQLVGKHFNSTQGQQLGEVRDIVIDPESGRVAYAVVAFKDGGEKLHAVPWTAFNRSNEILVLDLPAERIKTAPSFVATTWPDMSDRTWATEVHTFYGRPGYWEKHTKTVANGHTVEMFPPGTFDAPKLKTYTGTVVSYNESAVQPTVTLRVANEPERIIEVAPASYLQREKFELRPNETVTIKAAEFDRSGKKVLIGTELRRDDRVVILRDDRGSPKWRKAEMKHEREVDDDGEVEEKTKIKIKEKE
jgi:sporulation protein YlmC with PRC-barrel domain/predicted RecA/RadA family phage recombinase